MAAARPNRAISCRARYFAVCAGQTQRAQSRFSFWHFMRNTSANPHRAALQPLLPSLRSHHSRTEPQAAHRRMATRPHLRRVARFPTPWRPMPTPCRCLESHTRTAPMIEREKCTGPSIHSHTVKAQSVTVDFGAFKGKAATGLGWYVESQWRLAE